jgi:hypothetical protein
MEEQVDFLLFLIIFLHISYLNMVSLDVMLDREGFFSIKEKQSCAVRHTKNMKI